MPEFPFEGVVMKEKDAKLLELLPNMHHYTNLSLNGRWDLVALSHHSFEGWSTQAHNLQNTALYDYLVASNSTSQWP